MNFVSGPMRVNVTGAATRIKRRSFKRRLNRGINRVGRYLGHKDPKVILILAGAVGAVGSLFESRKASAATLPATMDGTTLYNSTMAIQTSSSGFTFTGNSTLSGNISIDIGSMQYLLVGGGGGGDNSTGGAGPNVQLAGGFGGAQTTGVLNTTSGAYTINVAAAVGADTVGNSSSITGVATAAGGANGNGGTNGTGTAGTAYPLITGTNYQYGARGGGGSTTNAAYQGGASGGGYGANETSKGGNFYNAGSGAANSGGGGGGAAHTSTNQRFLSAGGGGSGTVFVQYYGDNTAVTGGTNTAINAGNANYTNQFTTSGANTLGITAAASRQVATFAGNLTGTGGLNLDGPGTLILAGANNAYSGATAVNTGTLNLAGNITSSSVTVANGANMAGEGSITNSLTLNDNSTLHIDGSTLTSALTAGNLSLGGGGSSLVNVSLDAVPTTLGDVAIRVINYNGTLTGGIANLALANGDNFRSTSFSQNTGVSPKQINLDAHIYADKWTGVNNNSWDIGSTANWNNSGLGYAMADNKYFDPDVVTFDDTATGSTNVSLNLTVSPGSVFFNNAAKNYSLSGGGSIAGLTGLTKSNTGTASIGTQNTYTGPTTIAGGVLKVNAGQTSGVSGPLGNQTNGMASGSLIMTGGTLQYSNSNSYDYSSWMVTTGGQQWKIDTNGRSVTYASKLTGNSTLTLADTAASPGTLTISNSTTNYTGATTVNAGTLLLRDTTSFASNITNNATLQLNRTGTAGFAGKTSMTRLISGGGTLNINNNASGIAGQWTTFNSASVGLSNFTGTVNVNSGVLSMDLTGAWSGNPDMNVAVGGLLAIRGQNISVDALTGNGDVFNSYNGHGAAGDTLTVGANNGSGTFSGIIHGNVATGGTDGALEQGIINLVKSGSGTQTLSGINTYLGTTNVNGGTLNLTGSLSNTAVTVAGGAAISGEGTIGATGSLTLNNGAILHVDASTAGALNIGSGATGNLSLSGGAGTVNVAFSSVPTTIGDVTVHLLQYHGILSGNESNLALNNFFTTVRTPDFAIDAANKYVNAVFHTYADTWKGSISNAWDIGATANWNNSGTNADNKYFDGDSVTFDDTGANTTNVNLDATVTPAAVIFNNSAKSYNISGNGKIAGAASMTIGGGATVTLGTANTFTGGVNLNAGLLQVNASETAGSGPLGKSGTISLGGGTLQYSAVNANDYSGRFSTAANQKYNVDTNGQTVAWAAALNSSSGFLFLNDTAVTKGKLILGGVSSYNGNTTIAAGTLQIGSGNGNAALLGNGTYGGSITNQGALIYNSSAQQILSGLIIGTGSLTVNNGILTLNHSNAFSGGTTLSGGTLNLGDANAIGTGSGTLTVGNFASFDNTSSSNITLSNANIWNGSFAYLGTAHNLTLSNSVTLTASPIINVSANTLTVGGAISGNFGLSKDGAGTLVLANSGNSYSGSTTINQGILRMGADNALGQTNALIFGSVTGQTATLDLGGHDVAVGNLSTGLSNTGTNIIGSSSTTSDSILSITATSTIGVQIADSLSGGTRKVGLTLGTSGSYDPNTNTYLSPTAATFTFSQTGSSYTGDTLLRSGTLAAAANVNNVFSSRSDLYLGTLDPLNSPSYDRTTLDLSSASATLKSITVNVDSIHTQSENLLTLGSNRSLTIGDITGGDVTVGISNGQTGSPLTLLQVNNGGTLGINGNLTVGGNSLYGTSTVTLNGGAVNVGGSVNLNGSGYGSAASLVLDGAAQVTVNGDVTVGAGSDGPSTSTITLKTGSAGDTALNINGSLRIGSSHGSSDSTLLINGSGGQGGSGGKLTMFNGDILANPAMGSGSTASLVLDGGTLDLNTHNIGSLGGNVAVTAQRGTLMNVGQINGGSSGLNKTGLGTLVLAGTNSYGGATSVSAGTLHVTGTLANSPITVSNSQDSFGNTHYGTLSGTGSIHSVSFSGGHTVNGDGTIAAATLSPGTVGTVGELSISQGLDFTGEGIYHFDMNASNGSVTGWDMLDVTAANATIKLGGGSLALNLPLNDMNLSNTSWTILHTASTDHSQSGTLTVIDPGVSNLSFSTAWDGQDLKLIMDVSQAPVFVPNPNSTTLSVLVGMGGTATATLTNKGNAGGTFTASGSVGILSVTVDPNNSNQSPWVDPNKTATAHITLDATNLNPGLGQAVGSVIYTGDSTPVYTSTTQVKADVYQQTPGDTPHTNEQFLSMPLVQLGGDPSDPTAAWLKITQASVTGGAAGEYTIGGLKVGDIIAPNQSAGLLTYNYANGQGNLLKGKHKTTVTIGFAYVTPLGEAIQGGDAYQPAQVTFETDVPGTPAQVNNSNSRSAFGTQQTAVIPMFNSFGNLSSTTSLTDVIGTTGAGVIGTTANILSSSTSTTTDLTLAMAWRTRTHAEASGESTLPPMIEQGYSKYAGLASDVVQISGTQDNIFVLEMSYSQVELAKILGYGADRVDVMLGQMDTVIAHNWIGIGKMNSGGDGSWSYISTGDYVLGSVAEPTAINIGKWGLISESGTSYVWTVVKGDGQYAVVPEPSSFSLLGLGALGLLGRRRRRQSKKSAA